MPRRADALIERRRREAAEREAFRRLRRQTLSQLFLVLALTAPVILLLGPGGDNGPDDTAAQPAETHAGHTEVPAAPNTAETASAATSAEPSAPRAVRRTANRHGGSPASRWVALECEKVAELVRRNGMPLWMTTVAWRESRCIHRVTNFDRRTADRSYGLFQINVLGDLWTETRERCELEHPEQLLDPDVNVSCAAALYRAYGYRPWDSGKYFDR